MHALLLLLALVASAAAADGRYIQEMEGGLLTNRGYMAIGNRWYPTQNGLIVTDRPTYIIQQPAIDTSPEGMAADLDRKLRRSREESLIERDYRQLREEEERHY